MLIAPGLSWVPFPSWLLGPDPVFYTLALVQSLMSIAVFLCGPLDAGLLGLSPSPVHSASTSVHRAVVLTEYAVRKMHN